MANTDALKQFNVRLPDELVAQVNAVSVVDGVAVAQVVREALEAYVASKRDDADWQERKETILRERQHELESLLGSL